MLPPSLPVLVQHRKKFNFENKPWHVTEAKNFTDSRFFKQKMAKHGSRYRKQYPFQALKVPPHCAAAYTSTCTIKTTGKKVKNAE